MGRALTAKEFAFAQQRSSKDPTVVGVENLVVQLKARADESFSPGQKIHLVALGRVRRNRIVVFVEASDDQRLILRVPPSEQAMLDLVVDGRVELGIGYRVARMHFVCSSIVLAIDGALVSLAPPSPPKKQPRRGFARVAYRWPATLQTLDGTTMAGEPRNVSASGALIELSGPGQVDVEIGSVFRLLLVGIDAREYRMDAIAVRCLSDAGAACVAVHFENLSEVEQVRLELQVLRGIARRFLRVAVALACEAQFHVDDSLVHIRGVSENVSGGGVALQCEGANSLVVGDQGLLRIDLEESVTELADVRVLRVLEASEEGSRIVLEFPNISYDIRVSLVEFLMKKLGASRACAD